jgi:hypothetical protein
VLHEKKYDHEIETFDNRFYLYLSLDKINDYDFVCFFSQNDKEIKNKSKFKVLDQNEIEMEGILPSAGKYNFKLQFKNKETSIYEELNIFITCIETTSIKENELVFQFVCKPGEIFEPENLYVKIGTKVNFRLKIDNAISVCVWNIRKGGSCYPLQQQNGIFCGEVYIECDKISVFYDTINYLNVEFQRFHV